MRTAPTLAGPLWVLAHVVVDGDELTVDPAVATTRKLCDPERNEVERAFLERLPRVRRYEIDGDVLTVHDDDRAPLLTFRALDAAGTLVGSWSVVNYYRGDAVTTVVGGATLTADFDGTTVTGTTGVNRFRAGYAVDGRAITITPAAVTRMAALRPELGEQETHYLAALALARSFRVAGDLLHLLREGGTIAVTLHRAPAE
jgi:heat shock protein HslJ